MRERELAAGGAQVALLFRNHEDLLREFTYFLPDNTPPTAVSGRARAGRRGRSAERQAGEGGEEGAEHKDGREGARSGGTEEE